MTIEVVKGMDVQREPETGIGWVDNTNGAVSVATIEPIVQKMGRQIARWMGGTDHRGRGGPSLINRQSYAAPSTPYDIMRTAYQAVDNDDTVGAIADVIEGLSYQGLAFESDDAKEADAFNQLARDLNLDALARSFDREEFIYSQVVAGFWWGPVSYKVRLKGEKGRSSRKTFSMWAPVAITFLDPRKVVPLQPGPFGQDRLAWQAGQDEYNAYKASWQTGAYGDALMREFFNGPIGDQITEVEKQYLRSIGCQPEYLISLNPNTVKRFCRTKSHYERFPAFRLKRTFPILDLKQQLEEADRVTLVGAANYILLVRQGSEKEPATQAEIDNLQENFKVVAKVPVVTGDHRLNIDIITPKQDQTLSREKHDVLDRRLISTTLNAINLGTSTAAGGTSTTTSLTRGISAALESRRHMFRRFVEENVCRAIVEHPANDGTFETEPNLAFTPRRIQLTDDDAFYTAVLEMRGRREMSRATMLETFGFDEAVEAMRMEIEAERYDDIFQTHMPFDSPQNGQPGADPAAEAPRETPQESGTRGGRPAGTPDSAPRET